MKKRNLAVVILLSIFTFGLYDLYWLVVTKNAMNERNTRTKVPSIWTLFLPVAVFAVIMLIEVLLSAANKDGNVILNIITILLALAATIGLIVFPFIWLFKYCKAVSEYTNGHVSAAVAFLLLWFLRFIGVAVIQDAFNDTIDGVGPGATAQTPYPPVQQAGGVTSVPPHLMHQPAGPVSPVAHVAAPTPPVVPHDPSQLNGPVPPQPPVSPIS